MVRAIHKHLFKCRKSMGAYLSTFLPKIKKKVGVTISSAYFPGTHITAKPLVMFSLL